MVAVQGPSCANHTHFIWRKSGGNKHKERKRKEIPSIHDITPDMQRDPVINPNPVPLGNLLLLEEHQNTDERFDCGSARVAGGRQEQSTAW